MRILGFWVASVTFAGLQVACDADAGDADDGDLSHACKEICVLLVNHGAKPTGTGLLQHCAADDGHRGSREDSLELARAAIQNGADVNELVPPEDICYQPGDRGPLENALIEAMFSSFPEMVEMLLDHGADPSIIGHCGLTAMGAAKCFKQGHLANLLCARGIGDECGMFRTKELWLRPWEESRRRRRRRNRRSGSSNSSVRIIRGVRLELTRPS